MGKKDKKIKKVNSDDEPQGKTAAIIILVIMVLSVAGFAVLMGGPSVNTQTGNASLPSEVPMGMIFKNSLTNQTYLGTIRNGEQFVFPNITGYNNNTPMINLAAQIKSKDVINIYVDPKFNSSESTFMIEKALNGIKKIYTVSNDSTCNSNKLIITNNNASKYSGCMVFSAPKGHEYKIADILVYQLVK